MMKAHFSDFYLKPCFVLFFFLTSLFAAAALPFDDTLSAAELTDLKSGKVLIRNIGSYRKMSLTSKNKGAERIRDLMKDLRPTYLAEVIKIVPIKGNEDLDRRINDILLSIEDYAGIPYYSERAEKWYDLYSSAKIISSKKDGNSAMILADLEMSPFGVINTDILNENTGNYIYYESTNLNKLRYEDKITCVMPEKMKSSIVVFKDGNNWILYGAGGVAAPWIPFFNERIETSFINRIKTFCNFVFTKI
jgi:hypothetical protein